MSETCRWMNCEHDAEASDECGRLHCERCGCPEGTDPLYTLAAEWVRDEIRTVGSAEGYPTVIVCAACTDDEEVEAWETTSAEGSDMVDKNTKKS